MPNTVLKCPWMRPQDAVPYVAPPELFRDDSPCPPPAATKVELSWVSDQIKTTPVKKPAPKDSLTSSLVSPIPCILSPVPVMLSPPPAAAMAPLPKMTKSILDDDDVNRVQAISPTDSTRIGELQLEEERQHHKVLAAAAMQAPRTTQLFRSFESAFQSVGNAAAKKEAAVNVELNESNLADMTAVVVTPSKTNAPIAAKEAVASETTMNATLIETSPQAHATTMTTSFAISDTSTNDSATHECIAASGPSSADMNTTIIADHEANVTIVSLDSDPSQGLTQSPEQSVSDSVTSSLSFQEQVTSDDATVKQDESTDVAEPSSHPTSSTSGNNTGSSNKGRLLVLLDMKSCSQTAVTNQLYMFTVFGCNRIDYEKIDASDPANAALRETLHSLSGESCQYPQFFLARDDGSVSYWGDWDRFFETAENSRWLVQEFRDQRVSGGARGQPLSAARGTSQPILRLSSATASFAQHGLRTFKVRISSSAQQWIFAQMEIQAIQTVVDASKDMKSFALICWVSPQVNAATLVELENGGNTKDKVLSVWIF
ncbi:hypothetical protein MPSEU_000859200 [Mayamaea pseudoterrestris]|nr:hypothetical protein MPSEU_000859200 [Mayamaea pseudoterrestris]